MIWYSFPTNKRPSHYWQSFLPHCTFSQVEHATIKVDLFFPCPQQTNPLISGDEIQSNCLVKFSVRRRYQIICNMVDLDGKCFWWEYTNSSVRKKHTYKYNDNKLHVSEIGGPGKTLSCQSDDITQKLYAGLLLFLQYLTLVLNPSALVLACWQRHAITWKKKKIFIIKHTLWHSPGINFSRRNDELHP